MDTYKNDVTDVLLSRIIELNRENYNLRKMLKELLKKDKTEEIQNNDVPMLRNAMISKVQNMTVNK